MVSSDRKQAMLRSAPMLSCLLLAALCTGQAPAPAVPRPAAAELQGRESKPWPISQKWIGKDSLVDPGPPVLIAHERAWAEFWKGHDGGKNETPKVDFSRDVVFAWVRAASRWFPDIEASATQDRVTIRFIGYQHDIGPPRFPERTPAPKNSFCILALPRPPGPLMLLGVTRGVGGGGPVPDMVRGMGMLDAWCFGHGKGAEATAGTCGACDRKAKGGDALCVDCAGTRKVCATCGLSPAPKCPKPDGCHEVHVAAIGVCQACGEEIVAACDLLCERCAGKARCRLCGRARP
jgi:hypothetical protein